MEEEFVSSLFNWLTLNQLINGLLHSSGGVGSGR